MPPLLRARAAVFLLVLALSACGEAAHSRPVAAPVLAAPAQAPAVAVEATDPVDPVDPVTAQQLLGAGHYYRAAIDGQLSPALASALRAFQRVNGLTADGSLSDATQAALRHPRTPVLRAGPASRVEVDLTRQVLYLVEDGVLTAVLPVSSGSGASFVHLDGRPDTAVTPVGTFTILRRTLGVRSAELGVLYDAQYFYGGWAVHGVDVLAPVPDSHGCVQLSREDARWLYGQVAVGWTVVLYGGTHTFPVPAGQVT